MIPSCTGSLGRLGTYLNLAVLGRPRPRPSCPRPRTSLKIVKTVVLGRPRPTCILVLEVLVFGQGPSRPVDP